MTILGQSIANQLKRTLPVTSLPKGVFRYSVQISELQPFLQKLSVNDLALLKKRMTYSLEREREDTRSVVITLEQPFELEGQLLCALRLKGVFPQSENGKVKPYVGGAGFSETKLEPIGRTKIRGRKERKLNEFSASGTMGQARVSKEILAALKLGPAITDLPLGFGFFDELHFNDEPVGFVIYGMERRTDQRLTPLAKNHIFLGNKMLARKCGHLVENAGQLLRSTHESRLFHLAPHLGNYGINQNGVRLLDLDTTLPFASVPAEFRFAYYYLDISKALGHLFNFALILPGSQQTTYLSLIALLPNFLWGYFKGDISNPLLARIKSYYDGSFDRQKAGNLSSVFGFPDCYQSLGNPDFSTFGFGLVRPRIALEGFEDLAPQGTEVDLKDYRDQELFRLFYGALDTLATI